MGFSFSRTRTCSLFILAVASSGTAYAGEFLHMPFACRFDGAHVRLLPSEDRAYEVFGRREREIYTACSPADPSRCRSWFVHRFDLDCDGARVSWLEVAASAAREGGRDAWVDDGRFSMRMGRFWSVARDDGPGFARRRWRRAFPPSDELDAFGPGFGGAGSARRIVTLPPGFAPALGVPIAFSGDGDAAREAGMEEPSAPPAYAAPEPSVGFADRESDDVARQRPATAAVAEVATRDAEPEPQPIPELPQRAPRRDFVSATPPQPAVETAAVPTATDAALPTAPALKPATKVTVIKPDPFPQASGQEQPADGPVASYVPGTIKPVIINAAKSAAAEPAPQTSAATATHDAVHSQAITAPAPQPAKPSATGSMQTAASDLPPAAVSASSPLEASKGLDELGMATMATSAAALVLTALAAFGFWRWSRARVVPAPPADRDLASVSLGGGPRPNEPLLGIDHASATARRSVALTPSLDASRRADELPVPTTYEQALAALGVNADATIETIKKIVDGLRRSWHPDHATSEPDRGYRERRLRQINVAWDLVSQKRSAA